MASNVPRFASFRPKPKPAPEPPKEHQIKPQSTLETSKEHKRRERSRSPPAKKQKIEKDAAPSKTYFSDRRGDADVLKYGALNRYDVPAYRRYGYGYVLGLGTSQKIDRERSSDTKVYLTPARRPRQERLLTDKRIAREGSRMLRFIKPIHDSSHAVDDDFIAIGTRNAKVEDSNDEDEEALDASYRSMDAKPKPEQPLDPDTQYDSGTEVIGARSEVTKKNSELVRKTRESPTDVHAWLNFIDHQELMITLDGPAAELSDATRLQLADVRIPIYEEALKKVGSDPTSHLELYKGLFKEARKSWNETKLAAKHKEVLAKYPTSTDLWFMYLDFAQSSLAQFKYEACRTAFIQCLEAFHVSENAVPVETVLHVLIRLTSMVHGAGYQELSLAIWQTILERHLSRSRFDTAQSFEEFWESEGPRIGEEGSAGWKNAASDEVLMPNTKPLQPRAPPDSTFEDFAKREVDAMTKLRYPGRSSDDVGEDDAFHTIFFTDVQEYVKFVPMGAPVALVLDAFVCFCGLPSISQAAGLERRWRKDPFLASETTTRCASPGDAQSMSNGFEQKIGRFAACRVTSHQMTTEVLFEQSFSLEGARLSANFVRRLLKLTNTLCPEDTFAGYLLAFELAHYPSEVVKTAKRLLKSQPTNQRLYHTYGLIELNRGNTAKAAQVFSMALSLGKSSTFMSASDLDLLYSWVWEALSSGDQIKALWRLVSPSGKLPTRSDPAASPGQSTLNNIRATLSSTSEKALLAHDYTSAITCTSLLALLAYLPSSHDASLALHTHQNLTNYFHSHALSSSSVAEINAQMIARFLTYHATHARIVRPSLVRDALEPLIAAFPDNTILLSLYAANEYRFTIDDRVRGIMLQSALHGSEEQTVAGWFFGIHFETLRGEVAGSTSHSIRALYKRATHVDAVGAYSPALWGNYLRFEIAQYELEKEKVKGQSKGKDGKKRGWELRLDEAQIRVKETFYAGLTRVPWCKDFIMLAFTEVSEVFREEELKKVYGVMVEKEVRLYVEID